MGTADWSALNKTMLRSWYKLNITSEVVYEDHFENWLWEEIVESHPEVATALEEMGWPDFGGFYNAASSDSFQGTTIIDFDKGPTSVRFIYIGYFGVPATIRVFGQDGVLLGEATADPDFSYFGQEVGIIADKKNWFGGT